jgi:outer membrane protein
LLYLRALQNIKHKILKMKHVSLVLNVVLLIAVAALFVLHFSDRNIVQQEVEQRIHETRDLDVAYINYDSLISNYELVKELTSQLESTRTKLEAEYENRAKGLQTQFQTYQATVNNMTRGQIAAAEEDLMKKEQNLRQYQERLSLQLMQEEAKVQDQVYNAVADFIKDYAEKNNLRLVLTYQRGSGVWFAEDGLNITTEVIQGLNNLYKQEGGKASK